MILGIAGKKQTGKNTVGNIITNIAAHRKGYLKKGPDESWGKMQYDSGQYSGIYLKAFAYKVKQILSILTGVSVEFMETEGGKDTVIGVYAPLAGTVLWHVRMSDYKGVRDSVFKPLTVRLALQYIGTNVMRNALGKDVWVNALERELRHATDYVITDVRFPEEVAMIHDKGGKVVYMERPEVDNDDKHESENAITSTDCDYVIVNEGGIIHLIPKVEKLCIQAGLFPKQGQP